MFLLLRSCCAGGSLWGLDASVMVRSGAVRLPLVGVDRPAWCLRVLFITVISEFSFLRLVIVASVLYVIALG